MCHNLFSFWFVDTSHRVLRRCLDESRKLALERLGRARAPCLSDGLGRRIGEDLLFPSLHSIENARCRRLWRGFRYLKTAVHIGVDGAENDGMDHYFLAGQDCSQ